MKALPLFLALSVAGAGLRAQSPGALAPGRWPVGFTHLAAADTSRSLASGRPRPIDIGVWYPARASAAPHFTYRSYFLLTPPPQDSLPADEAARRELDGFATFLASHGASPAAVTAWLDAPMLARLDPPAASGQFPLVLVAQGNGQTLHDQAPLCSISRATGTSSLRRRRRCGSRARSPTSARWARGPRSRPGTWRSCSRTPRGGRTSTPGESASWATLRRAGGAAPGHAGAPRGGAGEPRRGNRNGDRAIRLEQVPTFDPAALRAPVLHFYERLDPFMAPEFGLLRSLTASDRWLVEVPAMHHHHFASLGAVSVTQPALAPALGATGETARAYLAVARATLDFLVRFLATIPARPLARTRMRCRRRSARPSISPAPAVDSAGFVRPGPGRVSSPHDLHRRPPARVPPPA